MINNTSYTSNAIVLNGVISKPVVTIYDTVGNSKSISCSLENRNTFVTADSNITYSYEYVNDGVTMAHSLHTPSSASQNESTPLLVWLHGGADPGTSAEQFSNGEFARIMKEWKLDGFNAYVLRPHLGGNFGGDWCNEYTLNHLNNLIDKVIREKNINTDKIMLAGDSLGGRGAIYVAYYGQDRYSSVVVFSGYYAPVDMSKIKIPIRGYVGTPAIGEDMDSYNFMLGMFKNHYGADKVFVKYASHGAVAKATFAEDTNNDNKFDLMEWMMSQ